MLVIGHRGARGYSPENTLESFQRAMLMHADGIEFDVHMSADGQIMVIHDDTVNRTTDGSGAIRDLTLQQLLKLRIDGKHPIPTLDQVFDIAGEKLLINVELKTGEATKPVVKLIEKYIANGRKKDRFLVSSFDWNALQQVRDLNPDIPLGVLTHTDIELAISFAQFLNTETIHPHYHLLTAENTLRMQRQGFKVFTWTVNEQQDIDQIKLLKPDGIITDFPDRI